jgi:hypothetical protein
LVFHYDSKRRIVRVENAARKAYEPNVVLSIEGGNDEPVNLELLVVGHLRVLAGLTRKADN